MATGNILVADDTNTETNASNRDYAQPVYVALDGPFSHATDGPGALAVIHSLEALQISSYLEWIPRLSPGAVRAAVASILTVDAQHLTMCRVLQGQDPVPGPFVTGSA